MTSVVMYYTMQQMGPKKQCHHASCVRKLSDLSKPTQKRKSPTSRPSPAPTKHRKGKGGLGTAAVEGGADEASCLTGDSVPLWSPTSLTHKPTWPKDKKFKVCSLKPLTQWLSSTG